MLIRKKDPLLEIDRLMVWHRWFAWHPVRVDDWTLLWLETVERRAGPGSFDGYGGPIWEYRRLVFDAA